MGLEKIMLLLFLNATIFFTTIYFHECYQICFIMKLISVSFYEKTKMDLFSQIQRFILLQRRIITYGILC